ncbi:MAG: hypothetical protein HOQ24_06090 [Mycobacteriaceae bacterium]|nr:hypothetical protein [Mycobacteriaceae bacterium]
MQGSSQRRVRVMYPDHPPCEYQAERSAAEEFAMSALLRGAIVIVDGRVAPDLPPLPAADEEDPHGLAG